MGKPKRLRKEKMARKKLEEVTLQFNSPEGELLDTMVVYMKPQEVLKFMKVQFAYEFTSDIPPKPIFIPKENNDTIKN